MKSISMALVLGLAMAAVGCGGRSGTATDSPAPRVTEAGVVHTFTLPRGEFVRVFLAGGATYEAELDGGRIQLAVRPVDPSLQAPRVEEKVPGSSAAGSSIFTIQPRADGDYEIRSVRGDPGAPVTLRLRMESVRTGS